MAAAKGVSTSHRAVLDGLKGKMPVLVHGMRTPFVKSFGSLMKVDSIGLGVSCCAGLLDKCKIDPKHIEHLIWGNVCLQTNAPNLAREIIIDLNLPKTLCGHMTSQACISGLNAIFQADQWIRTGQAECVLGGGSDSLSCAEVPLPRNLVHGLGVVTYGKKKGFDIYKTITKYAGPPGAKWFPTMPSITERSTGKTMGWHADMMAQINKISREDQNKLAVASHKNAAIAREKGIFKQEIWPTGANDGTDTVIDQDDLIQPPEKMNP
eukprot:57577_1